MSRKINPLRQILRDRGVSQSALAAELGICQAYLSRLLGGTRRMGADLALRVSKKYHVDLAELLQAGKRWPE
jgi:transcriptional regulator with XRE-family HTH domain